MGAEVVYLDNNATTALAPEALEAMLPWLRERAGNPSSLHPAGAAAADAVARARRAVARLIGARAPREVVFTSGGSEADVTALRSAARLGRERRGALRLVGTRIEHAAVLETLRALEREGFEVVLADCDAQGRVDAEHFERLLDGAPCALATCMWANNETGVVQDVARLGAAARARGVPFHVDAVQAVGKLEVDVGALAVDTLALSGHKFHGPKGTGALWVRRGFELAPLVTGGPQEGERRAGTENVPGLVGLGRAAELARERLPRAGELARLRERLERGLLDALEGVRVHGAHATRLCNTTNLSFEGVSGEALVTLLGERGLCASTGSACASGKQAASHVLLAMGCDLVETSSSLRLSLAFDTTPADVEAALERVPQAVRRLRALAGAHGPAPSPDRE